MNRRMITICLVFVAIGFLVHVSSNAFAAEIFLNMPATGATGKVVSATLGFTGVDDVISFELLVSFQSGAILTSGVDKFLANPAFFPDTKIGGEPANFLTSPQIGKIYVVGLSSGSASGQVSVGNLAFAVSGIAGDTQVVTLGGQIYTNTGEIQSLSPVSTTFTVADFEDSDNDTMDDQWERDHFGNLNRDGTGDFDMDGLTDLQEYQGGTNPTVFNAGNLTLGDINNSKTIDLTDAILGLQVSSGMPGSQPIYKGTDINQDGKIGIAEIIYILQKIANTP